MLSPDFLLHITEGAEEVASQIHTEMIKAIVDRIMARFKHGDDYVLTASDKWQIETLQEAGFLIEDIQRTLAKKTNLGIKEIKKAFKTAGVETIKYDDAIYKGAGLEVKPLEASPHLIRILERNFRETAGTWENITRTTANNCQKEFIRVCDKALNLANSGGIPMQKAVMDAIDELAKDGVAYIEYPSGHKDTMEVATLRAVRTGVNQTSAQICLKRMEEMEWDIILVSSHLGARNKDIEGIPYANHEKWQGKFYSRTGKKRFLKKSFPDFVSSTGYGTGEGLCGWNCRHSFGVGDGVHNNFEQYDTEENRKRYEAEQEARKYERTIRKYKRQYEVYKEALKNDPNNEDLKKRVNSTKDKCYALNTAYTAHCEANNLRPLEERLKTR